MKTYVAFLRGVNVSGHNKLAMASLRTAVEDLGYADVTTYLQSGNVVFKTAATTETKVVRALETAIRHACGLEVPVLVRSQDQLVRVSARNPLLRPRRDPSTLHVTFLAAPPSATLHRALPGATAGSDEFVLHGREVYLHCPNGYGRSKLTNAWMEKRLGTCATTRNWRTVLKLAELAVT